MVALFLLINFFIYKVVAHKKQEKSSYKSRKSIIKYTGQGSYHICTLYQTLESSARWKNLDSRWRPWMW